MDERVREGVLQHILRWCGVQTDALPDRFGSLDPAGQVAEVLQAALVARYGSSTGLKAYMRLRDAEL